LLDCKHCGPMQSPSTEGFDKINRFEVRKLTVKTVSKTAVVRVDMFLLHKCVENVFEFLRLV
jgi:hypothetical protein